MDTRVELGWLWYDDDPKTSLEQKVAEATERFRHKFGCWPGLCYVNPRALAGPEIVYGRLQLRSAGNVLPGHFLFVVE